MRLPVALLMVVVGCSSASGFNIYESSGLDQAVSLEVIAEQSDGSQQWMTVSQDDAVREIAALLDAELEVVDSDYCSDVVTVNFYAADSSNQQLEVGCDLVRLARAADASQYAAPEFNSAIWDLLSTLTP